MFSRSLRASLSACAILSFISASPAAADVLTFVASKDSFLRNGAPNTNEGANVKLNIRKVGKRRAIVHFDLSTLPDQIPSGMEVVSATLRLNVTNNNQLWGRLGRPIGAHMLLADWTEGIGSNARVVRRGETEEGEESDVTKNRGTGPGVTWKCATDSNVANLRPNCTSKWNGGSFNSTATDVINITNSTLGPIEFDVTSDVQSFVAGTFPNNGWLVKKVRQDKSGGIWVTSRDASENRPELEVQIGYRFNLDGASEVPPVTTSASGSCTAVLNQAQTQLDVNCTHTVSNATAAHIHNGAAGVAGPVVCDLGAAASPISATCSVDSTFLTNLTGGNLYVNVHSNANPSGEVRGQIN